MAKTQNETEKIYNCLENTAIHPHTTLSFGKLNSHLLKYQKTCRI